MTKKELILPESKVVTPQRKIFTPEIINKMVENEYLGLDSDFNDDEIHNLLMDATHKGIFTDPAMELLDVLSTPDYFYLTCKHIFNIRLLPFQLAILRELWIRKFPMFIAARGGGKTWLLSLYCVLRALFTQGSKIIVVGAAFRQSKLLFEYMEHFWRGSPILRNMVGSGQHQGPKRDIDRCNFYIGDSEIIAIPIGDGSKIRGLRANYTIADEFASIPQEVYEVVIKGFSSVNASPDIRVKDMANIKVLKSLGMYIEAEDVKEGMGSGNQTVISGTAYYHFNHFYSYWKRYKEIIESKGDKHKLGEIFKGEVPEGFDWKQFSIFRIPVHTLPDGFMDMSQVHQAKALVHRSIYNMEYGACEKEGTPIITQRGIIPIEKILVGDLVLTHRGRFRPITKLTYRKYSGKVNTYKTLYFNQYITTTQDHLFWYGEEKFQELRNDSTYLTNLVELYGLNQLNMENFCANYLETKTELIYPTPSQSRITVNEQKSIRNSNKSTKELAKLYNLSITTINRIKNNDTIPKGAIRKIIELSYEFGLIVGYYAAEGSVGANGRAISFALDEHKDTKYQKQLLEAIKSTFGIFGHKYIKKKNTCEIAINNRLLVELFTKICPGVSQTKLIKHEILYSNKEFLRGFIEGYWNGDGHIGNDIAVAHCTNLGLLSQVRVALSYFGVSSSLNYKSDNTFELVLHGDSFKNFINIFYSHLNKELSIGISKVINNGSLTILPIIDKLTSDYEGLVYNLEVEEDFSYSKPNATVHNCFARDSDGFFKRSLIESCVTKEPVLLPSGPVSFSAVTHGVPGVKYIYGIDPASEKDNFAIVILEVREDHRRIVYCWSINRQKMRERIQEQGKAADKSFYTFCAQKIRDLMKVFPTEHIGMDTQGGGVAIMEALHEKEFIRHGEVPLWPYIKYDDTDPFWWEDKDKPTDGESGSHILHMVQFANAKFTADSNHGLRKDFEERVTLFPYFDAVTISDAIGMDKITGRNYDTLEDCVVEIEELKDELATIQHTQTQNGRDKWDTPEVKLPGNKKGRLRKDRYTALIIANMIARTISHTPQKQPYIFVGGYAGQKPVSDEYNGKMYTGPEHIVSKMNEYGYGMGVFRR